MKKIKLTIAYDGTNYVGWQIQKNGLAIEQVINEHLSRLLKEPIAVCGASRTDSGVHARGNVATFYTKTRIPSSKISLALNQSLPDDIKIVHSEEVPDDFHPRYANCLKTYRYQILNCRYNDPTLRLYHDYVYYPLAVEKMCQGASYLIGEHDFIAFSSSGGQQKTTVRRIDSIEIKSEPLEIPGLSISLPIPVSTTMPESISVGSADKPIDRAQAAGAQAREPKAADTKAEGTVAAKDKAAIQRAEILTDYIPQRICITITGNGFLYNMVRIIVGTLEKVGMGVYPPEHVKEILDSKDRRLSAPKAAARGLTLMQIQYL